MHEYLYSHDPQSYFLHRIHDLHTIKFANHRMPKPFVAKVREAVAGAGVSFADACDLVIAEESALCYTGLLQHRHYVRWSSLFHLPRTIGIKRTMEITLLGGRYTARQIANLGLVNFVVPKHKLDDETD